MNTLSLFNCPTTIAWVDDDALFLSAGMSVLEEKYTFKTFNNPQSALRYFEQYNPTLPSMHFFRVCEEQENYDANKQMPVELDIQTLNEIRQQKLVREDISVLIVDYNMPGMTGIELCRKLKNIPMKKILLTGEVESKSAVAAFNEGIIDRFIRKDSTTLMSEISGYLSLLTDEYLSHNTKGLLSYLKIKQTTPFSDSRFIAFFNQWCSENNIQEYYLADKQGTFIVIDNNGKHSYFVTHTDRTLDSFVELNDDDEDVSTLIASVANRTLIPFFGTNKEAWQFEPHEWNQHFFAPQTVEGDNKYYWAVIPT